MRAALHIVGLAAVAVAQPIYDLLSRDAAFFVAHDSRPIDLLWLVAMLSVAVPAALLAPPGLVALLSRRSAERVQRVTVALLCGLIGLQVLTAFGATLDGDAIPPALLGLAVASGAYLAYVKAAAFRSFLSLLSVAALICPAIFLFTDPVWSLLSPSAPSGAGAAFVESDAPVVILVLDELPLTSLLDANEEIDAGRYPNFARFAATSHWFRGATTVAERTTLALPAILTGSYPDGNREPVAAEYPQNLFSLFAGSHPFSVFETHSRLCIAPSCDTELRGRRGDEPRAMLSDAVVAGLQVVLPRAWTRSLPPVTGTWRDFAALEDAPEMREAEPDFRERVHERRFDSPWLHDRFLHSFSAAQPRTLFFLHLSLPHVPWRYLPSGHEYRPAPIFPEGLDPQDRDLWGDDPWPVTQAVQRHLLQVGYADKLVGEMLDALGQAGLYDSALIAVLSDHGIGLEPGERRRGLSPGNLAEILCVPLMIKLPGQTQGVVSDRNAETIDLLPSIADALGAILPWSVDGESLFAADSVPRSTKTVFKRLPDKRNYERLSLSPAAVATARSERAARLRKHFGTGSFEHAFFAIGPHPELHGAALSQQRISEASATIAITLDKPSRQLAEVDPKAQLQPVRVTGTIRSPLAPIEDLQLAVSLDGTLRATTRTIRAADGRAGFSAMLPEAVLRPGLNQLDIFVIREDGQGTLLEATRQIAPGRN